MKPPFPLPTSRGRWLAVLALPAAVLVAEASAWWWMNPGSADRSVEVLSYRFPHQRPGYASAAPPAATVEILKCDSGQTGKITSPGGRQVEVSYFEWDGTDEQGLKQAFSHSPEVCMAAAGNQVEAFLPSRSFQVGEQQLKFDVTRFRDGRGDPLFIFKASWAEGIQGLNLLREGPSGADYRAFKFKAVRQRWKPHFARVVMGGVSGFQREEEAWVHFNETVLRDLAVKQAPLSSR